MLSKNKIKNIRALHRKKERHAQKAFLAEGTKIVGELLDSGQVPLLLAAEPDWLKDRSLPAGCELAECGESELKAAGTLTSPNRVLAVFPLPDMKPGTEGLIKQTCLLLDGVNDPGNLGTIIRSADWFGIEQVVCSAGSTDAWGPKAVQASMGSIARVGVSYAELPKLLGQKKTPPVYGTYMQGEDIGQCQMDSPAWFVFGSESHGIGPGLEDYITKKLSIPLHNRRGKHAESLNMAVSAAIVCHEYRRRFPAHGL